MQAFAPLQVPSQLVVRKIGAPIWLSVIVVAWGIVAAATAAMKTAGHFYLFRFLLGMCEAGESHRFIIFALYSSCMADKCLNSVGC